MYFPPFNSSTPVKLVLRFFEKRDRTHALCSLSAYVKESGFQNLGSGKVLLVESEIWENIACKIWNPGLTNGIQYLESGIQVLASRIQDCLGLISLAWSEV